VPIRSPLLIPEWLRASTGVAGAARPVLLGASAAWRTPDVIARSLPELLAPTTFGSMRAHPLDARRTATMSHRMLNTFARVRPARWRSTCLYRSVAECLVLRALGHPARVVVGVGADAGPQGVMAHAWVECEGIDCVSTRGAAELERLSSRRG
jgi:hypothetical protein